MMNNKIIRTNSSHPDFVELVKKLDAYLAIQDGDEHDFYDQFNKIDTLKNVIIAFDNATAVACGAIKEYSTESMEVKRMYTDISGRRKGWASKILKELEDWASELGYKYCILETGKRQPEAIELYKKCGYKIIPNYGQYAEMDNSVCFKKQLSNAS